MKAMWAVSSGVLALAGLVAAPTVAKAETHVGIGIVVGGGYRGDSRGAFQYGFDRGRSEGSERGYRDGRACRDADFWRESAYRDSDRGFKGWMGSRRDYEAGYRRGFESSYRRAYASARPGRYDHDHEHDHDHDRKTGSGYDGHDDRYRGDRGYDNNWRR